ncbi:MAG: ATP-binding protein [Mycoplasma sp.]|nr:ATP-binding protein [Mycoplasma sp.]
MQKYRIPSIWQNYEAFSSQKSSLIHSISEFIDNSISSYLKTNNNNIEGLHILIFIKTSYNESEDNALNQSIKIFDNAGGMNENELYHAMIPNDREGKSDNNLNQYGLGMKIASFWLGKSLKIQTRNRKNNQYIVDIDLTKHNLQDIAEFTIDHKIDEQIPWFKNNDTGTVITVGKIRNNPDRIIKSKDVHELSIGLGWRYSSLLSKFKLEIMYKSPEGRVQVEKQVSPFKVKPFVLSETAWAFSRNKKYSFNEEKYQSKVIHKIEEIYKKHSKQIDKITGDKNFVETLKNNEPLLFRYNALIESKNTIVEWGIIAEDETKRNWPYHLNELQGFTLMHSGRAIMHGPNNKKMNQGLKKEVRFGTYSFMKEDAHGGEQRYRWLFGTIDLTNIEKPDRNKVLFQWGPNGVQDIENIVDEIRKSMIDIINAIAMVSEKFKKPNHIITESSKKKIDEYSVDIYKNDHVEIHSNDYGVDFYVKKVKFNNNDIIEFKISHSSNDLYDMPFKFDFPNENSNTINIYINDEFYLWKDFIYRTDRYGCDFKIKLVYPLAAAFAICQLHYDATNNHNDPVREMSSSKKLSNNIAKMPFDEVFSTVLNYFISNEEE